MSDSRIKPDVVIALVLAVVFLAIAGVMWSPATIEALSRAGETNTLLRPYLHFMAGLGIANAILIVALVPICRRTSAWFAKVPLWSAIVLSSFILAEVGALVVVRALFNVQHVGSRYTNGFEFSPSMGFVPKPGFRFPLASGELTHTADGYRGPQPPDGSPGGRETYVMIGGSSTYDLGLPDDQTWPTNLGRIFADRMRVLNLGIPGHSTAEHVTLATLVAWKYRPDVIVYYIGWNDIRSSNVDESTDYARFHKKRMLHNFAITEPTSFFALGYVLKKIIALLDETSLHRLTEAVSEPGTRETVDTRLLGIYTHNVRTLVAVTREIGATPVFVPQVMNTHRLTEEESYGWIPRVPQRDIPRILGEFNEAMMKTARAAGATVIHEVLEVRWQDADFVDRGHFSRRGARRFACALAEGLLDRRVIAPTPDAAAVFSKNCTEASGDAKRP